MRCYMPIYLSVAVCLFSLLFSSCGIEKQEYEEFIEESTYNTDSTFISELATTSTFESAIETIDIKESTLVVVEESDMSVESFVETSIETSLETTIGVTTVVENVDLSESLNPNPDLSVCYLGNTVNEYYVDGYGYVYGFFNDTTGFNEQVNEHLIEIGSNPYLSFNTTDYNRVRAIECTVNFSHIRPDGTYCSEPEICTMCSADYAFENFRYSQIHWAAIEGGAIEGYTNLSSASFTRVGWYEDGYGGYQWQIESSVTVALI